VAAGRPRATLDDVDFQCDGAPLIEPGFYEAVAGVGVLIRVHNTWKLVVAFTVIVLDVEATDGRRFVPLCRYYNVSRPGRRVHVPPHSDYAREWTLIAGRRMGRRDRPHVHAFEGVLCRVQVGTVTHDRAQRPLPVHARYSKIARVVERLAGGVRQ
jgi:hypothetical protein